ncbi:uncharacterized protein LOC141897932 isoform X1 [Acropora palmata]|uniref:uncharacterized protein LOC141897932 isoform X1 n=2 Tax=Acropora palmata TaxID=6131 RepID=UPI003D9FEAD0
MQNFSAIFFLVLSRPVSRNLKVQLQLKAYTTSPSVLQRKARQTYFQIKLISFHSFKLSGHFSTKLFKMKRVAVFVVLLVFACKGENLRCLRCFSTVSAEDCLTGAKPKTCNNGESICLSHEIHSSMKGSRFVLTCGTRRHYQNLQKYCMKPQVSNRVGEVTCKTSLVAPAESEVFTK